MGLIHHIDELVSPPQRIVSLVPSLTESLAELGAASRLVGVTTWCWYPAEVVAPLPKVGGTKNPNLARIRELLPDLIVVNEEENRRADVEALAVDFPCWVTFPKTASDNAGLIRDLGQVTATAEKAAEFCARIEALEAAVRARVMARPSRSMAYLIWRDPWMTINGDTYIHDVLTFLNCTNPWVTHANRYPHLTSEDLIAADPDRICLSSEPFPFTPTDIALFEAAFPDLRAVREQQVFVADGTYFCWYGTRWVRALAAFLEEPMLA
ncbi:MAG: helical backbone metal receptor [bacterium]